MKVSMSVVWDRTAEFLSERSAALAGIAALALFVPEAVAEILTPLDAGAGPGLKLGLALVGLLLFVVSLWGQLAITALGLDPAIGTGEGWVRATRRLGAMILVVLALMLVALLLAAPVFGILIATGVDLTKLQETGAMQALTPATTGLIGLYALVLVPLVLWLMARIVILPAAVVVAENLALGALARSFRLTRGLALKLIGVLLLYGIVMWVSKMAVTTVVGSLLRLVLEGEGPITAASALTGLATALVATIFTIIGASFVAKLYLAVRAREDTAAALPA